MGPTSMIFAGCLRLNPSVSKMFGVLFYLVAKLNKISVSICEVKLVSLLH